ncbi:UDP-N-acetylmuramate dehydrogenase [Cohnella ginsengisoli]|uniref:UDP-N-acetylenolpyruvoylglucosamine reductase n=1 Tax=Cohnella ginsengisoli TaxID=425004 RepID=A0A9X4KK74_9BACL|nr:UDP-N-acetylmuramate dehydrogenase [Cohnella ginsengisoli]MDG0793276.1 UDP-N-acetylmuramate dehydrogenase [Cohnella ginsengisoli]
MEQLIADLERSYSGVVKQGEPLAPYTTWKIGGPADLFLVPADAEQLASAIAVLGRHGVPWTVLGRGSNTLVADRGVRGAVIKLGGGFDAARFEGNLVFAGGSYSFIKLSVMAGKEGLTGLEFASGIPGNVGGAVYMNAGAHHSDVSRILKSADIVWEDGSRGTYGNEEMRFGYRHSILHEKRGIVTEAVFALEPGDRKEIAAMLASYKDRRLRTQPLQLACAGSVFRNPEGDHAARLIEAAGLKGAREGGAVVSELHANFIVNEDHATAEDVLALMERVRRTVNERFGILLAPEVLLMGER